MARAFTLFETILYIALTSIILLTAVTFFGVLIDTQERNEAISIVNLEGQSIINNVTLVIRNSSGINYPAAALNGSEISIQYLDSQKNPTIIRNLNEDILIREGTNSELSINSNLVKVSNLIFSNVSRENSFGTIKFEFELSYINNSTRESKNYSQKFYASATVRN